MRTTHLAQRCRPIYTNNGTTTTHTRESALIDVPSASLRDKRRRRCGCVPRRCSCINYVAGSWQQARVVKDHSSGKCGGTCPPAGKSLPNSCQRKRAEKGLVIPGLQTSKGCTAAHFSCTAHKGMGSPILAPSAGLPAVGNKGGTAAPVVPVNDQNVVRQWSSAGVGRNKSTSNTPHQK